MSRILRQWSVWSCLSAYWTSFRELNVHLLLKIISETSTSTSNFFPHISVLLCDASCALSHEIEIWYQFVMVMGDRTNGRYPTAYVVLTSRRYIVFHRSCAPSAISFLHSNSNSTRIIDYHFFVSTSHIVDTSLSITFTNLYSNFVDKSNLKTFPPQDRTRWNIIIESWESLAVFTSTMDFSSSEKAS